MQNPALSFAWGQNGLRSLLPTCDAIVIVDVLSFSTAVDVAVARGALVFPYAYGREGALEYAARHAASLAQPRSAEGGQFSLSPKSLSALAPAQRLVLPSPNGSALSELTGGCPTFAGCLRNALAIGQAVRTLARRIGVIAAGEKWSDGTLRPALEDLLGAGAILDALEGDLSPDAEATRAAYRAMGENCAAAIRHCASGQELIDAGYEDDVAYALAQNISRTVPQLIDGAYQQAH